MTWVKRTIQKHHVAAEKAGVKIVHCCGYDSVPSDLGALMMVDYCRKSLNKKVDKVMNVALSVTLLPHHTFRLLAVCSCVHPATWGR